MNKEAKREEILKQVSLILLNLIFPLEINETKSFLSNKKQEKNFVICLIPLIYLGEAQEILGTPRGGYLCHNIFF